ncbi:hypothetical protein GCM10027599_00810 [Yimella radicis]
MIASFLTAAEMGGVVLAGWRLVRSSSTRAVTRSTVDNLEWESEVTLSRWAQGLAYADIREALRAPAENRWLIDGLYDLTRTSGV